MGETKLTQQTQENMPGTKQGMEDESNARSNEDDNQEISWKLRSLPPSHYIFKIENFSLLSDAKAECFLSADFEVGGYKWKLAVFPRGDKQNKGYVSLYLLLSKSNQLAFNQEVNVYFKLFVYDFIHDSYWIVQDANEQVRRFHALSRGWGFEKLKFVDDFKDESNGYLMGDCCIFGAEVFVIENANKGGCFSLKVIEPEFNTHRWTIGNFSELDLLSTKSEVFNIGGVMWSIHVYPKGVCAEERGKNISIGLELKDLLATLNHGRKLYAEYILRVRNQLGRKHREFKGHTEFDSSKNIRCFPRFMSLIDLNDKSKGFLRNNTLVVELKLMRMTMTYEFL